MTPTGIPAACSQTAEILRAAVPPAIIASAAILLRRFPPTQDSFFPRCPVHDLLGLQCPGCGATRAIAAALRGHFAEALHFNALATLLLPCAVAYGILCYTRLLQRKPLRWPQPPPAIIYTALTLAAIFSVIRNLPPYAF
jgi:hypothetical protein